MYVSESITLRKIFWLINKKYKQITKRILIIWIIIWISDYLDWNVWFDWIHLNVLTSTFLIESIIPKFQLMQQNIVFNMYLKYK